MKKLILAIAALGAVGAAAAPAAAQPYPGYDRDYTRPYEQNQGWRDDARGYGERIDQLSRRIDRASERGRLDRREAYRLREAVRDVQRVAWRYRQDGRLTPPERADLDRRLDRIEAQLRFDRRDNDDRRYDDRRYDDGRRY